MRKSIGELNGGWAFLLKLSLALVVPGVTSQLWLARSVWVMDTKIMFLTDGMNQMRHNLDSMNARVIQLEKVKP